MITASGKKRVPFKRIKSFSADTVFEFHILHTVRKKYDFDETLFSFNGNIVLANFQASRNFTFKLNEKREADDKVRTGQVNAMGLLDEIYHFILRKYEVDVNPQVFNRALKYLNNSLGEEKVRSTLIKFIELYPPAEIYKGNISAVQYFERMTDGKAHPEITLEEMILLYFANFNPGNIKFKELFDDSILQFQSSYNEIIALLDNFFEREKPFGPDSQPIFDLLRAPIINNPASLEEQLKFVMNKWSFILDEKYLRMLLTSMDLIKEDTRFDMFFGGGAPTVVPKYKGMVDESDMLSLGKSGFKYGAGSHLTYLEPEKFTQDIHWMPRVVLLAKNVYVWLDQLSKKYSRSIHRLDEIPDGELDILANSNFTALWLIGLWERSRASQMIKQIMGNPDAVPSAYSLYDYVIANDLGGEDAFQNLNERCKKRGIRLASDMVPNHMGIFSKWIQEKPHYFVQTSIPPFPNYSFTKYDLSDDPDIQIRIEDGYWDRRDAAVVFQRIDNRTGEVSYIYHGNDGTNMPWNDTAQLDMLKAEVREAVIQTIFHVARKTHIIRFDAAMTLAKIHFQRLWYPQPGTGGDIPSRSDYAKTKEEFDEFFPKEFWREVVDRFNEEMPDTLLLAEAFWLMEGYFVRTLGMHRVYNSAFMHMMMKEENAKYRDVISNTLEFNPEILKRYVNFMSNPDEETAIKQFGTDDKYFGVCLMMITLPGLPMFGHGQIEGFTEKYGMEYRRAYYNELPNEWLIERHRREIFPLMQKRYMFAEVFNFWFYDFIDVNGNVNENVFAYSNKYQNEKALIVYNNKFEETKGRIKYSTGKAVPAGNGDEKKIAYSNIAEALEIKAGDNFYYVFREQISNLEFIRTGKDINDNGIYFELQAFKHQAFVDFREVYDATGDYFNITNHLNGKGVPGIEQAIIELKLQPLYDAYYKLFDSLLFDSIEFYFSEGKMTDFDERVNIISNRYQYFIWQVKSWFNLKTSSVEIVEQFKNGIYALQSFNTLLDNKNFSIEGSSYLNEEFMRSIQVSKTANNHRSMLIYMIWLSINNLYKLFEQPQNNEKSLEVFDELLLHHPVRNILHRLGKSEFDVEMDMTLLRILIKFNSFNIKLNEIHFEHMKNGKAFMPDRTVTSIFGKDESELLITLLKDYEVRRFIGANLYDGVWYYSKENFEDLIDWLLTIDILSYIEKVGDKSSADLTSVNYMKDAFHLDRFLKEASKKSEYQLEKLIKYLTIKED